MFEKNSSRRSFLSFLGMGAALPALAACGTSAQAQSYRVSYSDEEWQRRLSSSQYRILRQAGTERAYSSSLNDEGRAGVFHCRGCNNALYRSRTKFDSGTGWPSFYRAADSGAVGYSTDYKIGYPRREVHCSDCGGHLGHVFDDGPRPTGKRHCINGVALRFRPSV